MTSVKCIPGTNPIVRIIHKNIYLATTKWKRNRAECCGRYNIKCPLILEKASLDSRLFLQ